MGEEREEDGVSSWLRHRPAWHSALYALGLALLAFSYRDLASIGARVGFEKGVEYYLFRPGDNIPIVIVALSLWLAYRRLPRFLALPDLRGSRSAIVSSFVAGLSILAWSVHTGAPDLLVFSLMFNCVGLVLSAKGPQGLRVLMLPIAFLIFAIPLPAPLLLVVLWELQIATAGLAGEILQILQLPVLVSGDQVILATQRFQVIDGCSGLRSIEMLSMLTILLIDLFRRSGLHAALLFVTAPLLAFALNGLRVVTLILNPHSEIVAIHNLQGIAILLAGLLLIYFLDGYLERIIKSQPTAALLVDGAARRTPREWLKPAMFLGLALANASTSLWAPTWDEPRDAAVPLAIVMSDALAEWPTEMAHADPAFFGSARFYSSWFRVHHLEDGDVSVFVGTADFGQRGGTPISPINRLPGSGWTVQESTSSGPVGTDGEEGELLIAMKGRERRLVLHWDHGRRSLLEETARSLLALDQSGLRRSDIQYTVRLDSVVKGRGVEAQERAKALILRVRERLVPGLQRLAPPG